LEQRRPDQRHDKEDSTKDLKRRPPPERGDQPEIRERTEDGLAAAVAADHETDDESALVRKPLRAHGRRRRVAEPVSDADDDAEEHGQGKQRRGEARQHEAGADQDAAEKGADPRALLGSILVSAGFVLTSFTTSLLALYVF